MYLSGTGICKGGINTAEGSNGGIWTCKISMMLVIDDFHWFKPGFELQDNMPGIGNKMIIYCRGTSVFRYYILHLKKKTPQNCNKQKKGQKTPTPFPPPAPQKRILAEFQPWNLFFKQERHIIYYKKTQYMKIQNSKLNIEKYSILQKDLL